MVQFTSSRTVLLFVLLRFITITHNFILVHNFSVVMPYSCFFATSPVLPFLLSKEPGAGFEAGTAVAAGASAGAGAAGRADADGGTGADADVDAGAGGITATVGPGRGGIAGSCRPGGADAAADALTAAPPFAWPNMASMVAAAARAAASAAAMVAVGSSEEDALDSFRFLLSLLPSAAALPLATVLSSVSTP